MHPVRPPLLAGQFRIVTNSLDAKQADKATNQLTYFVKREWNRKSGALTYIKQAASEQD